MSLHHLFQRSGGQGGMQELEPPCGEERDRWRKRDWICRKRESCKEYIYSRGLSSGNELQDHRRGMAEGNTGPGQLPPQALPPLKF